MFVYSMYPISLTNRIVRSQLFQLRSIEQNELAIIADTQHKAIFVFTAVTIIFLPLSFFTSYFGMNLQGVVNTDKTESYFWKVGGSVSFCLVLTTCFWAFRYRIQHEKWASRFFDSDLKGNR